MSINLELDRKNNCRGGVDKYWTIYTM